MKVHCLFEQSGKDRARIRSEIHPQFDNKLTYHSGKEECHNPYVQYRESGACNTNNGNDFWLRTPDEIKKDALAIINKYKGESEEV